MAWFGKGKKLSPASKPSAQLLSQLDLVLVGIEGGQIAFHSKRTYPLNTRLYMNASSPAIETVRSTGIEVVLSESRSVGKGAFEYTGRLTRGTPEVLAWLAQVEEQGPLTVENQASYVSLHLDQRMERRAPRAFRAMSPELPGFQAITCDISRTGVRLQTQEALPIRQVIKLMLYFDDEGYQPIETMAQVMWCMQKEAQRWWMGLRFTEMDESSQRSLISYMEYTETYAKRRFRGTL